MKEQPVTHDERTDAVAGAGCRLAYLVLWTGVCVIAAVRHWAFGQMCWDLLGLAFVSLGVLFVFQRVKHVQAFSWRIFVLFFALGAVFGLAMALLKR